MGWQLHALIHMAGQSLTGHGWQLFIHLFFCCNITFMWVTSFKLDTFTSINSDTPIDGMETNLLSLTHCDATFVAQEKASYVIKDRHHWCSTLCVHFASDLQTFRVNSWPNVFSSLVSFGSTVHDNATSMHETLLSEQWCWSSNTPSHDQQTSCRNWRQFTLSCLWLCPCQQCLCVCHHKCHVCCCFFHSVLVTFNSFNFQIHLLWSFNKTACVTHEHITTMFKIIARTVMKIAS